MCVHRHVLDKPIKYGRYFYESAWSVAYLTTHAACWWSGGVAVYVQLRACVATC